VEVELAAALVVLMEVMAMVAAKFFGCSFKFRLILPAWLQTGQQMIVYFL
jgi:hypothetical protein